MKGRTSSKSVCTRYLGFAEPLICVALGSHYAFVQPYGRILDLTPPTPGPAGTLRSSVITFRKARAAAIARNCAHGLVVPNASSSTRLNTVYERPLKAHAVRDWLTSHPRLVIPVVVFLIGSITYTVTCNFNIVISAAHNTCIQIFDPIRVFVVEGRLLDWFDYRSSYPISMKKGSA